MQVMSYKFAFKMIRKHLLLSLQQTSILITQLKTSDAYSCTNGFGIFFRIKYVFNYFCQIETCHVTIFDYYDIKLYSSDIILVFCKRTDNCVDTYPSHFLMIRKSNHLSYQAIWYSSHSSVM